MTPASPVDPLPRVIQIINENTRTELRYRIGAKARLKADLEIDAIDRQCIACAIDEAFGIEIPDDAVDAWITVADVTATADRLIIAKVLQRPVAQPNWAALGLGSQWEAEGRN